MHKAWKYSIELSIVLNYPYFAYLLKASLPHPTDAWLLFWKLLQFIKLVLRVFILRSTILERIQEIHKKKSKKPSWWFLGYQLFFLTLFFSLVVWSLVFCHWCHGLKITAENWSWNELIDKIFTPYVS